MDIKLIAIGTAHNDYGLWIFISVIIVMTLTAIFFFGTREDKTLKNLPPSALANVDISFEWLPSEAPIQAMLAAKAKAQREAIVIKNFANRLSTIALLGWNKKQRPKLPTQTSLIDVTPDDKKHIS